MPRVSDLLLQSTIYLYRTEDAAEAGDLVGGSGVLIGIESAHSDVRTFPTTELWFVTCDHVVQTAPVVRIIPRVGDAEYVEHTWTGSLTKDPDVAVAYFRTVSGVGGESPYSYIPFSRFASPADFEVLPPNADGSNPERPYYFGALIGPGDDTVMVGRFVADDGILSQTPTLRFGNIASDGPVVVRFEDYRRPSVQECMLVESRSLPGYSGSAVYQFHGQSTLGGIEKPVGAEGNVLWRFLGIDCAHMNQKVDTYGLATSGWVPAMAFPGQPRESRTNAGMMTVVPAWTITEALEDAIAKREKPDDSGLSLDSLNAPEDNSLTAAGFEEALRRATRIKPQAGSGPER